MRNRLALCLAIFALGSAGSAQGRDDPNESAIKARTGEMQLRAFNAGPLFAMAKGDLPYDAALASTLAGNLKLLLELDNSRLWPRGSSIEDYPGKTTTKPKLWTTYPEISKYGKNYATAVTDLDAAAGNGLDALRSKIGPLGKSCKGCHDEFRQKD